MNSGFLMLFLEAIAFYLLVLGAHCLRRRFGPAFFYALIGGLTALMSWVTDAGLRVEAAGITFVVGSTVFYTALLLGVFVVYVFDGPRPARGLIVTIAAISVMTPLVALLLHFHSGLAAPGLEMAVPFPSVRINIASVLATIADLIFLAISWEFLGKPGRRIPLWARSLLTLLGVMCLDVVLFATGAFAGSPQYFGIMAGTLTSRIVVLAVAFPLLYGYLEWQSSRRGATIVNRPVLAILERVAEIRNELDQARREIDARKAAELERDKLIRELQQALGEVKTLRGFLPICASCKKIRDDKGYWNQIEAYIQEHSAARFSHGLCPECVAKLYPDMGKKG